MIVGNQKRFWFRWNCNGIMSERDVSANKLMAWLHKIGGTGTENENREQEKVDV